MIEQLKMLKSFLISIATDISEGKMPSDDLYLFFISQARREIVNIRSMVHDMGLPKNISRPY